MTYPKAICFDLLTGLLNSWTIWDNVIPESEKHITDGVTWRSKYLELTYGCGEYRPYEELVSQAATQVGLSDVAPRALFERYDEILPWPEVPAVLAKLKQKGIKLAIATNCSNELGHRAVSNCEKTVRAQTDVKDFVFDQVVTSEECGFYKPHPKPYQSALNRLDLQADEVLFLAGSAIDIPGASGVGMKVCWNNHIGMKRKHEIEPLKEGISLDEALSEYL